MAEVTELFEQIRRYKLENQSYAAIKDQKVGERQIKKEDSSLVREFEGYL